MYKIIDTHFSKYRQQENHTQNDEDYSCMIVNQLGIPISIPFSNRIEAEKYLNLLEGCKDYSI